MLVLVTVLALAACSDEAQPAQPLPPSLDEGQITVVGEAGAASSEELSSAADAITEELGSRPQFSALEALPDASTLRLYWHGQAPSDALGEVLERHPEIAVEVVGTSYSPETLREAAERLVSTEPGVGAAVPLADGSGIRIEVFPEEVSGTPEDLADRITRETGIPIEIGTAPPVPAD